MRIASLYVTNFLGIQHAEVSLRAPVALFAGQNAAGKSSLRDAVALALTADLGRVSLKKDAPALIREGADLAVCEVVDADGDQRRVTINSAGKFNHSHKGHDTDPVLPYVLDAQRFARLAPTERRSFLFGLMGVKMGAADIAARLAAKGCDDAKVQRVLPLLRGGFDAAADEAKRKTSEARGAWKVVTGEAFGDVKAKTWRAAVPAFDAARLKDLATAVEHADVAIGQWQEQIGKLAAEEQRRQGLRAKLPALQEHAAKVPRIEAKLAADDASMQAAQQELARVSAAAGAGPRVGLVHELARAVAFFLLCVPDDDQDADFVRARAALEAYERDHGPLDSTAADPEAQAKLPDLRAQLELLQRAVANDRRDLQAAQEAHAQAKAITDELAEVFDAAALVDAREQVEKLKAERAAAAAEVDKLKSIKAAADAAEAKTAQAALHAADVAAWDAIAQALAPDGIPADLLAEALGPINARLAQSSADADWATVTISADMDIRIGSRDRAYALCSESERWRADAMLAEAIAHVSGAGLLVLDRVDVLDLQGRADLFAWLDVLAETGEVHSALLFATLKQPPAGLGDRVNVHWIDAGCVGMELAEAA